jgi:hypothetical protein
MREWSYLLPQICEVHPHMMIWLMMLTLVPDSPAMMHIKLLLLVFRVLIEAVLVKLLVFPWMMVLVVS